MAREPVDRFPGRAALRDYAGDCFGGKLPLARFSDVPSRCSRTPTSAARIAARRRAAVIVRGPRPCAGLREWAQASQDTSGRRSSPSSGAGAGDSEGRVEREAGLDCGMRLVQSTKLREGGGQLKIYQRKVSVGLDRPPTPRDRLLVTAEVELRKARDISSRRKHRIARTEAQGLGNMSLCFFGATDKNLSQSDHGMGCGKISIQRQRMFTFGDALCGALGQYLEMPQQPMATRMVRDRRQGFGHFRFGRRKGRRWGFSPSHPPLGPPTPIQRARRHCRDRR